MEAHPADWRRRGRGVVRLRNAEMIALGADGSVAFLRGASPARRPPSGWPGPRGYPSGSMHERLAPGLGPAPDDGADRLAADREV